MDELVGGAETPGVARINTEVANNEINSNTDNNEQVSTGMDSNVGQKNEVRGDSEDMNSELLERVARIKSRRIRQVNLIQHMHFADVYDDELVESLLSQVDEEINANIVSLEEDEEIVEDLHLDHSLTRLREAMEERRFFRILIQSMETPPPPHPRASCIDRNLDYLMRVYREILEQSQDLIGSQQPSPQPLSAEKFEEFEKVIYDDEMAEEDDDICSICLDERKVDQNIVILPCTHKFHYDCAKENFNNHTTCPVCRREYDE